MLPPMIFTPFERMVAFRYLRARRQEGFVSVIAIFSLLGIAHDISMLVLTLLLVGHVFFAFVYDAWSSMGSGYVSRDDMLLEHRDWVEELDHEGTNR